jgi:hypothetical protein
LGYSLSYGDLGFERGKNIAASRFANLVRGS